MKRISIEQIARAERAVKLQSGDSFLISYPEFIAYFASLETITVHSLIIGAHFVYGWMPTILELKNPGEKLAVAVDILNEVKLGKLVGENELERLRDLINNSLVGTSKLLHFISPNVYAIWDSHTYKFINGRVSYNRMTSPENYLAYLANCREIIQDERFKEIHNSMNAKVGYRVTPYRAVELIMYMSAD